MTLRPAMTHLRTAPAIAPGVRRQSARKPLKPHATGLPGPVRRTPGLPKPIRPTIRPRPGSSPVFDPLGGSTLSTGRPASRRSPISRRAQGGSRAKSEASLEATEHGGSARRRKGPRSACSTPSGMHIGKRRGGRRARPPQGTLRFAARYGLDPSCARRLTGGVGDAGRPFKQVRPRRGRNTGLMLFLPSEASRSGGGQAAPWRGGDD